MFGFKGHRVLALAICVVMLLAAAPLAVASETTFDEKITFTFSSVDANKAGMDEEGNPEANFEWLKEKFNVEFEFYTLDWSNYIDQTRLWLAGGDAPDLMMLDVDITRYPEFVGWVNDGLFKAYPDLSAYPNIAKRMDAMISGKKFYVNDQLYAWPAYLDLGQYNYLTITQPLYRKDWARAVGLCNENNEYTWEEWTALIKAVQEKDPGGNGVGNTIGMYGQTWMFPVYFGPGAISPMLNQVFRDESGKFVWGPGLPETLEAFKLTKQIYDEGIVWKDQPLARMDTLDEMFVAGKAFSIITGNVNVKGMDEVADDMVKVNPSFNPETDLAIAEMKGPGGKLITREMNDQWSQTAMNANLSQEKVDRWMAILDYMVSDEGYLVRTLGIPGKDWEYGADGKPVVLWPTDESGNQVFPYQNGTWPWARSFGCNDGFDLISPAYPAWIQAAVDAAYRRLSADDVAIVPLDMELNYFSGPMWDKRGQNIKIVEDVLIEAITSGGDVEAAWNAYVADEKADVDAVLNELTAALQ